MPAHVVAAELDLGVAADPDGAASALAVAQRRHPGDLQAALADALGDASLAAAVLRRGSGPGLGAGGTVRLLPAPEPVPQAAPQSAMRVAPLLARPAAGGGNRSWLGRRALEVITGAEHVAGHFEETGGELSFQGAAGLKTIGRAGVMVLSSVLPRQWERDAAAAAGSAWDAGSAVGGIADGGLPMGVFGLWAARITLLGHAALRRLELPGRPAGGDEGRAHRRLRADDRLRPHRRRARHGRPEPRDGGRGDGRDPAARARAVCRRLGHHRRLLRLPRTDPRSGGPSGLRSRAVEGVASAARSTVHAALDAVNPFD